MVRIVDICLLILKGVLRGCRRVFPDTSHLTAVFIHISVLSGGSGFQKSRCGFSIVEEIEIRDARRRRSAVSAAIHF